MRPARRGRARGSRPIEDHRWHESFFFLNFRVSQKIDKCTLESKRVKQEISNAYSQRFAGIPLSADTRIRVYVCVRVYPHGNHRFMVKPAD